MVQLTSTNLVPEKTWHRNKKEQQVTQNLTLPPSRHSKPRPISQLFWKDWWINDIDLSLSKNWTLDSRLYSPQRLHKGGRKEMLRTTKMRPRKLKNVDTDNLGNSSFSSNFSFFLLKQSALCSTITTKIHTRAKWCYHNKQFVVKQSATTIPCTMNPKNNTTISPNPHRQWHTLMKFGQANEGKLTKIR